MRAAGTKEVRALRSLVAVLGLVSGLCLRAAGDPGTVRALLREEPLRVTNYTDEVVVYVCDLDLLRGACSNLSAQVSLDNAECTVDLSAPYQTPAIVVRKPAGAQPRALHVTLRAEGQPIWDRELPLGPVVRARTDIPRSEGTAFIEPGQAELAPQIELPDLARLRPEPLLPAERVVDYAAATLRVRSAVNYPLISANNNCAISVQTAHPGDLSRRSLYLPVKSQLFDPESGQPTTVAHYLVEVPLDDEWLQGEGDLQVNLPPTAIRVHSTERKWPEGAPNAQALLGQGDGGLGQLVGVVDVDDAGRIYYATSVPSGVVRFNPATAQWEAPPVDLEAQLSRYLPAPEQLPAALRTGAVSLRWEGYRIIAVMGSRLFYAPIITAVYQREDQTSLVFAGVFSLPLEHWDDPEAFAAGIRFHVGSWPGCAHAFWSDWTDPADRTRKLGRLIPRPDGLYITAYQSGWGGPWRLQLDEEGNTSAFERVQAVPPGGPAGLPTSATGLADWWSYGTVTMTRSALHRILRGQVAELPGTVSINYDAIAAMRLAPERYGALLAASSGPSLAPVYMATAVPDEPDTMLGVGEYGYYLARFDLSHADEGYVTKSYLLRDLGATDLELPLPVGLGPYGYLWWDHEGGRYLYIGGYTGLTRLVWRAPDLPAGRYRMEDFTQRLQVNALDQAGPDGIKRYRYLLPGLDGRIFLTGTHEAARGGTAYSGGLMSFSVERRDVLDKLSFMSRCHWTVDLRSRVVHLPGAAPTQELVLGADGYDQTYAFMLEEALRPANRDPRIFVYDYQSGGVPRALFGFSLPPSDDPGSYHDHEFDATRRYLLVLQGQSLLSLDVRTWRFADGINLSAEGPVRPVRFFRSDECFLRAPDDRLFLYLTVGEEPVEGTFYEVQVASDGTLSLAPHLTLRAANAAQLARTFGVVRAFVPDLRARDGSCDLVLGVPFRPPGTDLRLIRDFIPPRR